MLAWSRRTAAASKPKHHGDLRQSRRHRLAHLGVAVARRWSMNRLSKAVRDYLTMRRGLGFKLVRHEAGLREFLSFLARKRSTCITVNLAMEWATQDARSEEHTS